MTTEQHTIAHTEDELVAAIKQADAAGLPVRVFGAGQTPPADFDGHAIEFTTTGLDVNEDGCDPSGLVYCGAVTATVAAGEVWDDFVARAVAAEWVGLEALSGIPGTVGEVAAANARAYGQTISDAVASIHTFDRQLGERKYLAFAYCEFGDDGTRLTRDLMPDGSPRFVPLKVGFLLKQGDLTTPIRDQQLAALLGVEPGARVPLTRVREAVLAERDRTT